MTMIGKYVMHWVLAAAVALASVSATAAECIRLATLWPQEETEITENGEIMWMGENMSPKEYAEYVDSKGSPAAQCLIAGLYFAGIGHPQNFEKAAEILLNKDIRFCTPNFIDLGTMFKYGLGVAKDPAKATYWFRAFLVAAPDLTQRTQGLTEFIDEARSATGGMIKADITAALAWLERVSEEPPERLYERGRAYLKTGEAGAGFPLADAMLRRAAQAGHEHAALTHARLYLDCEIGAYGRSPRSYLRRFAKAGHVQAATLLGSNSNYGMIFREGIFRSLF